MGATMTLHRREEHFFPNTSCPQLCSTEWRAGIYNGREHNTCIYYPKTLNNDPKLMKALKQIIITLHDTPSQAQGCQTSFAHQNLRFIPVMEIPYFSRF